VCLWEGVECHLEQHNADGLVKKLSLENNNLAGIIVPELALLGNDCFVLDLSSNRIGGK